MPTKTGRRVYCVAPETTNAMAIMVTEYNTNSTVIAVL